MLALRKSRTTRPLERPHRCRYCSAPVTKALLWAEGRAFVPTCEEHESEARARIREQYGEPDRAAELPVIKGAKPDREFSSAQIDLPEDLASAVRSLAAKIPDEVLAADGREERPHVTVKFGIHGSDPAGVEAALKGEPPVRFVLGKVALFPAKPGADYDVVKVDVESPDLERLNAKIASAVPCTDTHPEYRPHVTLAYVKPGEGRRFAGDSPLEGREGEARTVVFSGKDRKETEIPLGGLRQNGTRGILKGVVLALRKAASIRGKPGLVLERHRVKTPSGGTAQAGRWVRPRKGETHPLGHAPSTDEARQVVRDRGHGPIPPTSWGLWVNPDPDAEIQAKWIDARGRPQYRYHSRHEEAAAVRKFAALAAFQAALPDLRRRVASDLKRSDADRRRVAAAVISIIDATGMRVGSEQFALREGDPTYGASSLRKEHARIRGGKVVLEFVGKHHKEWGRELNDPALVSAVRHLLSLPGERVFQYRVGDSLFPLDEGKVNEYLKANAGVSARVFRTYHATRIAAEVLTEAGPPADEKQAKREIAAAMDRVAEFLGNTPSVARSSYVNPAVLDAYVGGKLFPEAWR